jgi:hypothetical protein
MLEHTPAFDQAVRRSHTRHTKLEVYRGGVREAVLYPNNGRVRMSVQPGCRREGTFTIIDDTGSLSPVEATDLLNTFGTEVRPWMGIEHASAPLDPLLNRPVDWKLLGTLGIYKCRVTDDPTQGLIIELETYDRAKRIQRFGWVDPISKQGQADIVIRELIVDRYPAATFAGWQTSTYTMPNMVFGATGLGDPWNDIQQLAESIGMDVYPNESGDFELQPISDLSLTSISDVYEEDDDAGLLPDLVKVDQHPTALATVSSETSSDLGFNIVIVTAQSPWISDSLRAVIKDTDPGSATYVGVPDGNSSYGAVTFEPPATDKVTTLVQAFDMALGIFRRKSGASRRVSFTSIVNPAHEPGDVIRIRRTRSRIDDLYVMDDLEIPFDPQGTMSVNCRIKQVL